MDGDWIQAAVSLALVAGVAGWGVRPTDDRVLRRWQERFSVAVPGELRAEAARRLRRRRSTGAVAIAAGLLIASSPAYMNLVAPHRSGEVANPATGQAWLLAAAVGALAAELWVGHRPAGPRRAAIVRRRVRDYVELRWVSTAVALAAVALGASAVDVASEGMGGGWWWVYAAGALVALLATGHGLRTVRDRPMAAPDGPSRDLDEAFRADGAHHIVGASAALAATSAAGALSLAFDSTPVVGLVAHLLSLAALGLWWTMACDVRWSVQARRLATP